MSITEVAVTASSTDPAVHIWDLRSGAVLGTLKGNKSNARATATLPLPSHLGGALISSTFLAAQNDRGLVHAWNWAKAQLLTKFVLPENLTSLAMSNSGIYAVGGGQSGRVYIWQMNTGQLLRAFDGHYKAVKVIRFTTDDLAFITGGEDSVANVWLLASTIDPQADTDPSPHRSLSGHALPITDIAVGVGLFGSARIFTSSADRTCKVWEALSGDLLTTIVYHKPITSIALDVTETRLFAGSSEGLIYRTNLYHRSAGGEAVGLRQGVDDIRSDESVLMGHSQSITSLALSFDGSILLSGSIDGTAMVWDTTSSQALRTFSTHKAPVTDVKILLKPPHLMDPSASAHNFFPIKPWARHVLPAGEVRHDPSVELPTLAGDLTSTSHPTTTLQPTFLTSISDKLRTLDSTPSESALETAHAKLQQQVQQLQQQNEQLVGINDELYQGAVTVLMRDLA
ncbi:quinon protein alcohol dehydrogenase-like superfamily [Fimicolochytrium jonesii]|uniref:quinon protein alcohol dehydrogenase-like superfamily n=1 Tax=Fimicolochytrium jonesii TaxID=1396493 RepID=UPI0022FED8D4|nr:quinon protein alcohol dehydrogenase-like superfamily [Fimicolochytrium jonesii]KAI8818530.1 quinon protein alcohol dehydrogenase-like superfamily [Fimicolochytrium jonesii]